MLSLIRKHKRAVSFTLIFVITQGIFSESAMALTSGPSQPETQQFAPAGMDNLVDPFSGDFSYNIPLMDVGGYPINLNYASGITPDAEASWVGLGWNINVGAINRSMRGLPDDFAGDQVTKEYHTKPNETFGVSGNMQLEIYGAKLDEFGKKIKDPAGKVVKDKNKKIGDVGVTANFFYNTYNGFGMSMGVSPSVSAGSKTGYTADMGVNFTAGSETGLEITPSVGLSRKQTKDGVENTLSAKVGLPFSTREGLKGMTLSGSNTDKDAATKQKKSGIDGNAFYGFATPTYTPSLEHNTFNVNASLALNFSAPGAATDGFPFGFSGYYSGEFLKEVERDIPAYGYLYSGLSQSDDKLMDFNREKDGAFNKFTTNLALTNFTYDVFQVSGQGVGGTYRLYRGDVGAVSDAVSTNQGVVPGLGLEFGASAGTAKVGVDASFSYSQTYSGPWQSISNGIKKFNNESSTLLNHPQNEMAYFKKMGEMSAENSAYYLGNIQMGNKVVRHGLASSNYDMGDGELNGKYIDKGLIDYSIPGDNRRDTRRERTTPFTTLTASEATTSNILPIENHELNNFNWNVKTGNLRNSDANNSNIGYTSYPIARNGGDRKGHHISEIRVTDNSGARYVYGIPAYNTYQEDVTFSVSKGNEDNMVSGMIEYEKDVDDTKNNKKGLDNYYNKVITPAYAHSYLLTTVLSADYVDRDNILGPSDGDLGTYTKFNYVRVIEKFKWRTPFSKEGGEGSYSQGMLESGDDDKANYVYGEKEVWYLHSIETRTHVAEFHLKDREDARGVVDRHGAIGGQKQKYVDKIVLYSKPDKLNSKAEPIKVVHFEYDYSLCPHVNNNAGDAVMVDRDGNVSKETNINAKQGKLTLKKVWFTYGNSQKGVLNPYVFNYADQDFDGVEDADLNPEYKIKNYDRWGNYKKDNATPAHPELSNAEFPYTSQDKNEVDRNSAVYALSSIQTPTAGNLRVYYESDDYAYVQNKKAMRMFRVSGCAVDNSDTDEGNSELYDIHGKKLYLVVDLAEGFKPKVSANANPEFIEKYLSGIELLYFKFHTQVLSIDNRNEFVSGYAGIDKGGSVLMAPDVNGYYHKAKILVTESNAGGLAGHVNPITKTGWMFARMHLNREMMASGNAEDNGLEQFLRAILAQREGIMRLFTGFSGKMWLEGNSKKFTANRSFIRLNEPDNFKMGGGHRVKAIVMVDNWGLMKSQKELAQSTNAKQTSFYGQKYDYTYTQEDGSLISAGVAAYEPSMGGDENPFHQPVPQKEKIPLAPDKEFYVETPFGESFFPGASVGYRKVVVTPIKVVANSIVINQLTGNGTGFVENEFYTALDHPTIVTQTSLDLKRHKPNVIMKFMKFDSRDLVTCTQGYYIELNDMHGKQRANRVYPEISTSALAQGVKPQAISEVEYFYKKNADGSLSNRVDYVDEKLAITRADQGFEMGVDIDMVQDQRYFESSTVGGGLQFNLKLVAPFVVPTAFPDYSNETTRFRSVVTTKVVNKYAILETTVARDNGAEITTKNIAWDAKTGQVLLTETQNEFHDLVYSFTYPGHWSYERMGLAASNEGMTFNDATLPAVKSALRDGDELYVNSSDTVVYVSNTSGTPQFINRGGNPALPFTFAKVIRSGARNIATTPVGSVVTLENPIKAGNTSVVFNKVLNAGVNEYKEGWKRFCNCASLESNPNKTTNPFMLGLRGNIRPLRNWTYLTNRTQSRINDNLNVRHDGVFYDFTPFWVYNTVSGKPFLYPVPSVGNTKWQFITQIQNYNSVGMAIEEQDALNRFSMALYGYGRNLQIAGSNNSQYRETGYDGFEDYGFGDCEDDHMSWRAFKNNLTNTQSHTGRNSIKVSQNEKLKISKVIVPCQPDSILH